MLVKDYDKTALSEFCERHDFWEDKNAGVLSQLYFGSNERSKEKRLSMIR